MGVREAEVRHVRAFVARFASCLAFEAPASLQQNRNVPRTARRARATDKKEIAGKE
jgi:hypothetical protein